MHVFRTVTGRKFNFHPPQLLSTRRVWRRESADTDFRYGRTDLRYAMLSAAFLRAKAEISAAGLSDEARRLLIDGDHDTRVALLALGPDNASATLVQAGDAGQQLVAAAPPTVSVFAVPSKSLALAGTVCGPAWHVSLLAQMPDDSPVTRERKAAWRIFTFVYLLQMLNGISNASAKAMTIATTVTGAKENDIVTDRKNPKAPKAGGKASEIKVASAPMRALIAKASEIKRGAGETVEAAAARILNDPAFFTPEWKQLFYTLALIDADGRPTAEGTRFARGEKPAWTAEETAAYEADMEEAEKRGLAKAGLAAGAAFTAAGGEMRQLLADAGRQLEADIDMNAALREEQFERRQQVAREQQTAAITQDAEARQERSDEDANERQRLTTSRLKKINEYQNSMQMNQEALAQKLVLDSQRQASAQARGRENMAPPPRQRSSESTVP